MLDSLQTQPINEGFHPAIPQGFFAGLRIAVGSAELRGAAACCVAYLISPNRQDGHPNQATFQLPLTTTHPGAVINFNKQNRRFHASSAASRRQSPHDSFYEAKLNSLNYRGELP